MGLLSFIKERLGKSDIPLNGAALSAAIDEYAAEFAVRNLAFCSAINLIAGAVSKCRFKTYYKNKEILGDEHYRWNYSPNANQSASVFMRKLITKLYVNNEALVVGSGQQLLVADSFDVDEFAIYDNVFSGVTVGNMQFQRSFTQSDVLYYRLSEIDAKKVVDELYSSYSKMMTHAQKVFQMSGGIKGVLEIDKIPQGGETDALQAYLNEQWKVYLTKPNAIAYALRGSKFTETGTGRKNTDTTRDIRAMVNDIFDFTALGFGIPPILLRGDTAGIEAGVLDQFLTFCIAPLVDIIETENNRKIYGKNVLDGEFVKIDTRNIRHVDVLGAAVNIDKLISSAYYSIDEVRELVGDVQIGEEWSKKHHMTKNYTEVENLDQT